MKDITLDFEIADGIALASLVQHYKMLDEQLREHNTGVRKLHPDDYAHNLYLLDCMEPIIQYYGGEINNI